MTALYLLGALLLVLLIGVLLAPVLEREEMDVPLEELPPAERREAALEALRELEFEHETGKLPEEEYRRLRARYGRVALEAKERLEEAGTSEGPASRPPERSEERLEGGATPAAGEGGRGRCPACSATVSREASFCQRCGEPQRPASGEDDR